MREGPDKKERAVETDSSSSGVAAHGGSVSVARKLDANYFLRLGRSIRDDFLKRRLRTDEFLVLVWLLLEANPHNGTVKVSYEGLSQDLQGEYSKNRITKIVSRLKAKEYVYFPKRQGKSGSFLVHLNNYPLSNGRFTNIERKIGTTASVGSNAMSVTEFGDGERKIKPSRSEAEVISFQEKFIARLNELQNDFFKTFNNFGTSTNNENNTENDNKKYEEKSLQRRQEMQMVARSESDIESDRRQCEEIASAIGDKNPALVLARCAEFGLDIVEEAFAQAMEAQRTGRARNVGALFNSIVQQLGREKLREKRVLEEPL